MDLYEVAQRANELPARFKERLSPNSYKYFQLFITAGEWGEALENLIAALHQTNTPITPEDRDELHALLTAIHMPTDGLDALEIRP